MLRITRLSRRIALGSVVLTLTLGGFLFQPAAALAGFGTLPDSRGESSAPSRGCATGKHLPEATLTV